jgi:dTDP-4-amino-4,6-dideoxygalactose transaminase
MIAFNRPFFAGPELDYIQQATAAAHLSGDGAFTKRCQAALESATGSPKALLTTSCTDALELSALLLDVQPGDEIILPSFTFVSTANAFVIRGAVPVFADIRPDTLNIDDRQIESLITPRTRAIIVVHYAGVGCEMDPILEVAGRYGVPVVEDNAHGLFGRYRGRPLGSFGSLATLSFHETKNVSCGEGGALLVNDLSLVTRAEILREKGTNRSAFLRGQVDKYTWVDIGSSFLPSDLLAAVLYAQLEALTAIQQRRLEVWRRYAEGLAGWAREYGVRLPYVPGHCEHAAHMFYVLLPAGERDRFIDHLRACGVQSVFHYVPLHASPMAARWPPRAVCPVTEDVSDRLARLPFYTALDAATQDRVIDAVTRYRPIGDW